MPLPIAPAVTRAIAHKGGHCAEVTVFLHNGSTTQVLGPPRAGRPEALKDCLELRKVAAKCANNPTLFTAFPDMALRHVRQRKTELEDVTWTMKDLGGRLLEGAEGPPLGFAAPAGWAGAETAPAAKTLAAARPGIGGAAGKFKGLVKGSAASSDNVVEVADVPDAVPGGGSGWEAKAKVALQQAFKRFGPVMEVRLDAGDGPEEIALVRFASAKAAEACMVKAAQGFLQVGEREVRLRQPTAAEAVWRKFPPKRRGPPIDEAAPKKKLRPNERFAAKLPAPGQEEEPDESERFWDEQRGKRGVAAEPPPPVAPAEPPPPEAPEKPQPVAPEACATPDDLEVHKGEQEVAKELDAILEKPFSQQKKALKKLRLLWHPDKNQDKLEVATRVFQFIQAHDKWLAHHELG